MDLLVCLKKILMHIYIWTTWKFFMWPMRLWSNCPGQPTSAWMWRYRHSCSLLLWPMRLQVTSWIIWFVLDISYIWIIWFDYKYFFDNLICLIWLQILPWIILCDLIWLQIIFWIIWFDLIWLQIIFCIIWFDLFRLYFLRTKIWFDLTISQSQQKYLIWFD